MGFILIDMKKREERRKLRALVPTYVKEFDHWINTYPNDGTPPTVTECSDLEETKVNEILEKFDAEAGNLKRVADEVSDRRHLLEHNLKSRKGYLFYKFSDTVDALQDQAARTMKQCLEQLNQSVKELNSILPVQESVISKEFDDLIKGCEEYITATYPEGVSGIDSYDDVLPDGIPSYADFLKLVKEKEEAFKKANKDAVEPEIEKVKASSKEMFKTVINKAVANAMAEIEADLSDDVLPFLTESQMMVLRADLIAASKEYGESRMDK
mmetsp:Transcript_1980/g.4887  ORF Transcript_1980/g.4887 Transcript_1980/m.4887 type:complete len:269 (-) Transcript_1980:344-1150(-)|eukprot:CAMPEP_0119560134 /NCGR_PEP_ID=MMETSP1352-20130426/14099_1 /TAXON_ID=265584 /ORGANISM="Stauroneis constricta, Strain CCMP1120" /LENGTH=268 /DNA_ID=CAMNT_0007608045 /DNA_START=74 /DNA_END=880 /DNA_ORIENTATION=+